jgi:hypothetical protein
VAIRIESGPERLYARDAVTLKHIQQLALGKLHTIEKALQCRILARRFCRNMLDGAAEIVADGKHVAGEIGDRIARGIGLLAVGAAAQILHIGHGAEQAIAHVGILGDESSELGVRLGRGVDALGIGASDSRLILRTRVGRFVGHRLSLTRRTVILIPDIDRERRKIKGQGGQAGGPCSQPWG